MKKALAVTEKKDYNDFKINKTETQLLKGMRFSIRLSPNREAIPFSYYYQLAGIFHSWLGPNELHDMMSLYNVGSLFDTRVKPTAHGLYFPNGADWVIGIYHEEIAERLIAGLLLKPFEFYGMKIQQVKRQEPPKWESLTGYYWASAPILTRWKAEPGNSREHLIYTDPPQMVSLATTMTFVKVVAIWTISQKC